MKRLPFYFNAESGRIRAWSITSPGYPLKLALIASGLWLAGCSATSEPEPDIVIPDNTSNIKITEAAATNISLTDAEGDTPDWFEIYNSSNAAVNLAGWSISDDEDKPAKWLFPSVTLQAGEYVKVWASDKDRIDDELHTNFKISSDGEWLQLYDDTGNVIDKLFVDSPRAGYSRGLNADSEAGYFGTPTPGAANGDDFVAGFVESRVVFNDDGGLHNSQQITLTGASAGQSIRYTLDASEPTEDSTLYENAIGISSTAVIRAKIFEANSAPSPGASRTYLPGVEHNLPIVTLTTTPSHFFDNDTGIYVLGDEHERRLPYFGANFWQDWEREITFQFYEPGGVLGVDFNAGLKIFGGWSRANDQRSLALFARKEYGTPKFEYPFFDNRPYQDFEALVLRNSGNDWMRTMIGDAVATSLLAGTGLDYQAYRPTVTYLNGEYWGIYNLREKVNEHFLASRHDVDAEDITILEADASVVEGDNESYLALMDFVENQSLADPDNYAVVEEQIEIENFITYFVAQLYFNNTDWPGNNIKYWKSPETRWRWILYDTDFGFGLSGFRPGYTEDSLTYATATDSTSKFNAPWSTLLFRRLLENSQFQREFINRFADALNSRFLAESIEKRITDYAAVIESEMPSQIERWPTGGRRPYTIDSWQDELERMTLFAQMRPSYIKQHIATFFNLEGTTSVLVECDLNNGCLTLNTLDISEGNWQGDYFIGNPVTITAKANAGFEFKHWQHDPAQTDATITVLPEEVPVLVPVFAPAGA